MPPEADAVLATNELSLKLVVLLPDAVADALPPAPAPAVPWLAPPHTARRDGIVRHTHACAPLSANVAVASPPEAPAVAPLPPPPAPPGRQSRCPKPASPTCTRKRQRRARRPAAPGTYRPRCSHAAPARRPLRLRHVPAMRRRAARIGQAHRSAGPAVSPRVAPPAAAAGHAVVRDRTEPARRRRTGTHRAARATRLPGTGARSHARPARQGQPGIGHGPHVAAVVRRTRSAAGRPARRPGPAGARRRSRRPRHSHSSSPPTESAPGRRAGPRPRRRRVPGRPRRPASPRHAPARPASGRHRRDVHHLGARDVGRRGPRPARPAIARWHPPRTARPARRRTVHRDQVPAVVSLAVRLDVALPATPPAPPVLP